MPKRHIILTFWIMCMGLITTLAQDDVPTTRVWSPIESVSMSFVEVEDSDLLALELMITGFHTDACDYDLMSEQIVYPNNIDVQLYRDIPLAATCLREDTSFEAVVTLEPSASDLPSYLTINDQVWEMIVAEDDSVSTDDVPMLEELTLVGVVVEDVSVAVADDETPTYEFALNGSHGVGCEVPLVYNVRELADLTVIGVFNPIPQLATCPAMIIILDETIEIPATLLEEDTLVTVNEYIINELETQTMSDTTRVMTNINTVTVNVMESSPMQISLEVSGEHPDGCDLPVRVGQSRDGNTVEIEIYREVPNDMMCPMILNPYEATIQLEGTFDSGNYTITVNGVTQNIDI